MANGKVKNAKQTAKTTGVGIQMKMVLGILPAVIIALVIMALVMVLESKEQIQSETQSTMEQTLDAQSNYVNGQLDLIKQMAISLSYSVSNTYKTADIETYASLFQEVLSKNDLASGAGIWFAANAFDKNEEYYGPYWYKDGGSFVEDWEYSNADYDYFSQEYYINAIALKPGEATITDPYYDPASATVMSTCSVPIYDGDKCLGCITVDITLDTVQDALSSVSIAKDGILLLMDSQGTYIFHPMNAEAVESGVKITEDTSGIASAGSTIMSKESGKTSYKIGKDEYIIYFTTIPGVNWKLATSVASNAIVAPVKKMQVIAVIITAIAIVISAVVIILQASSIATAMKKVKAFAQELAGGNFTIEPVNIKRNDEIGDMSRSLNEMYESNSSVIRNITHGSEKVNVSSNKIDDVAVHLSNEFENIQSSMIRVNDAMSNTGAATEQVSASANEVNESVLKLSEETSVIAEEVKKIKERASKIERDSMESSDNAIKIAEARGAALREASKKAEVVSEIGTMADAIADIADQINLLSLNASIEAARAGEHGRGFAVVASEINNLATDTKEAVDKIQDTITAVQDAFESLNRDSGELLTFVQETVTPDYDNFIEIGRQYGQDAESFGKLTEQISEMVGYIRESMEQVNAAVGSIAESATETATSSSEVTNTVNEVSEMVSDVSGMAQEQKGVSDNLSEIVSRFRLSKE